MGVQVNIINNAQQVLAQFKKNKQLALKMIGAKAQDYASKDAPVDTGRLRQSIQYQVADDHVEIGTNVEYAKYVEFIDRYHHNSGKAHFLRDAASTHNDEYVEIIKSVMQ